MRLSKKCLAPSKEASKEVPGTVRISAWHLPPTAILASLALLLGLLSHPAAAKDEPAEKPPPEVRSEVQELPWATVLDVVLPGEVLDVAPWPTDTAPLQDADLAVLVAPEDEPDGPRHLYRLRGHASDLEPIEESFPQDSGSLHSHQGRLWIGEEGRISRYAPGYGLSTLLELEGLDLESLVQRGLITETGVLIPEVGGARFYTSDLQATGERFELPVEARRRARRLELWSPPMRRHGDADRWDASRWVSDPQAVDSHRLRVHMIDPAADEDSRLQESWLRFADAEEVEQFHFTHIDGRPALIVATTRGDKLGIFEKLRVRTFTLKPDRTRSGRLPRAQVDTVSRNWYRVEPRIVDFDGNGKDDLLLIQPQGLGAGELLVELHLGRGGGLLEPRSRRSKLKAESATWDMSYDFTGDGTLDLVLVTPDEIAIHPGLAKHKKQVIDSRPVYRLDSVVQSASGTTVSVELGSDGSESQALGLGGKPRLLQLDADPTPEIVQLDEVRGRGIVRVVNFLR